MSVLSIVSGLAKAGGQAYEGYGQDQQIKVKDALASAKAAEEERRNAVLNRVALAGIDPASRGAIAGAEANAKVPAAVSEANQLSPIHTTEAVNTATQLAPVHTKQAVDQATQLSPITTKTAVETAKAEVPIKAREAENSAAATERHAPPIPVANKDGSQTLVRRSDAVGQQQAVSGSGGASMIRGLGPGGVFGAGSGLGSVKEMQAANPNLKKFEQGFLGEMPTSSLGALDRFRTRLANDLQTHGAISAATATEAERELAATNPDLVNYGRNLKQWVVSDMNLSRGGTDERARMDQAVSGLSVPLSSMPPEQRATFLNQMWEARDARLEGLVQSAAAAKAILDRVSGSAGAGHPQAHATPTASRAQQLWDAAVAKHGEAKVLQEVGPRPPE